MSNTIYYLAWLAVGLLASAAASAWLLRSLRLRAARRAEAPLLFDALARYCAWMAGQRRAMLFQADAWGGDAALEEVRSLQQQWFAPLEAEAAQLFEAHRQLVNFLWTQQVMRLKDAEAWLLSEPDPKFMALWEVHHQAAQAFAARLGQLAGVPPAAWDAGPDAGSRFAA